MAIGLKLKESWLGINPSRVSPEGEDEGFCFFLIHRSTQCFALPHRGEGEKGTGAETFVCQIPPVPGSGAYEVLCVVLPSILFSRTDPVGPMKEGYQAAVGGSMGGRTRAPRPCRTLRASSLGGAGGFPHVVI